MPQPCNRAPLVPRKAKAINMGDTMAAKVATLRRQLGLPEGKPMVETVDEAARQLGLDSEVAGLNLAAKVDA